MHQSDFYNDSIIIAKIAEGDQAAFESLFHEYRDRVYSISYKLTHSVELSEEIVQDVFLKIWLKRKELPELTHFKAYLYTMVRNQAYNYLKAIANRQVIVEISDINYPKTGMADTRILEKENQQLLEAAVKRLPPQQQIIYKLIGEQGLKREEVSQQMGISPETVKTHIAQAMRSIRAYCLSRTNIAGLLIFYFL